MRIMKNYFAPSDAWILAAIFLATGNRSKTSLVDIIGYGDAINHAILTYEELAGGLVRLASAGMISGLDSQFQVQGIAESWRQTLNERSLDVRGAVAWLRQRLDECGGTSVRAEPSFPGLSRRLFDDAVATYRGSMRNVLDKIGHENGA